MKRSERQHRTGWRSGVRSRLLEDTRKTIIHRKSQAHLHHTWTVQQGKTDIWFLMVLIWYGGSV